MSTRLILLTLSMLVTTTTMALTLRKTGGEQMVSVSVGVSGVWAVSDNYTAFYREDTYGTTGVTGESWIPVMGAEIKQLDVGTNIVWGVSRDGNIYFRDGISADKVTGKAWKKVSGELRFISVSPRNHVWGVNVKNEVFIRTGFNKKKPQGKDWKKVTGNLTMVSVGTAGVWGVDNNNDVYYKANTFGDCNSLGDKWQFIPDMKMSYVTSAFGYVLGISEGRLYLRRGMSHANPTGDMWRAIQKKREDFLVVDALHDIYWAIRMVEDVDEVFKSKINIC